MSNKRKKTKNRFAELLAKKARREERRISPINVIEETNLGKPTIYSWYNNTVTRFDQRIIDALCEYLNCDVGDLLTREESSDDTEESPLPAIPV